MGWIQQGEIVAAKVGPGTAEATLNAQRGLLPLLTWR